jgi:myo-inositol-1(or 4)-monophosphatase
MTSLEEVLERIELGLESARSIFAKYEPGDVAYRFKQGDDPVTEADHAVDAALKELLHRTGEGWLSEETVDSADRLAHSDVWIVDPLDGTREFVSGVPEWCVSIGFTRDGEAVAGGICNPVTGQSVVGAKGLGVKYNGQPASTSALSSLDGARITASRSEIRRGEWDRFEGEGFKIVPCGSVAYKLGLVACGECEATWTLVPKHEWDVAAGAALVLAAGGNVFTIDGSAVVFNQPKPKLSGMIATAPGLAIPISEFLQIELKDVPHA